MPSAAHDDLPLVEIVPGYSSRMADWGGITVAFEQAHAGQDASSMVKGLPDDRCQAPHWGYLFSGKMIVDYGDRQETIEGGQAYYVPPGTRSRSRRTAKRSSSRRRRRSSRRSRRPAGTSPPARRSTLERVVTELYDLRVTVERIEGRSVCGLEVGDYFELTESSRITDPARKALLPLRPAGGHAAAPREAARPGRRRLARAGLPRLLPRPRGAPDHAHRADRPAAGCPPPT